MSYAVLSAGSAAVSILCAAVCYWALRGHREILAEMLAAIEAIKEPSQFQAPEEK